MLQPHSGVFGSACDGRQTWDMRAGVPEHWPAVRLQPEHGAVRPARLWRQAEVQHRRSATQQWSRQARRGALWTARAALGCLAMGVPSQALASSTARAATRLSAAAQTSWRWAVARRTRGRAQSQSFLPRCAAAPRRRCACQAPPRLGTGGLCNFCITSPGTFGVVALSIVCFQVSCKCWWSCTGRFVRACVCSLLADVQTVCSDQCAACHYLWQAVRGLEKA